MMSPSVFLCLLTTVPTWLTNYQQSVAEINVHSHMQHSSTNINYLAIT
jgi:hypothetical protein